MPELPWLSTALVLAGAMLVNALALWYLNRSTRASRVAQAEQQAEREFEAATGQAVDDVGHGVVSLGKVVHGTRQRIAELERQFRMMETSTLQVTRRHGVQRAIELARDGAPAADIVSHCGLSEAEARLLAQVHAGLHSH